MEGEAEETELAARVDLAGEVEERGGADLAGRKVEDLDPPAFSTTNSRSRSSGGAVAKTGSANPEVTRVAAMPEMFACGPFGSKP